MYVYAIYMYFPTFYDISDDFAPYRLYYLKWCRSHPPPVMCVV